jgi:hypothetical protein
VPLRHGCLIAYGQTGAGKTFTMQGPDDYTVDEAIEGEAADGAAGGDAMDVAGGAGGIVDVDSEQQGLIPRVLKRIFQRIADETAGGGAVQVEST